MKISTQTRYAVRFLLELSIYQQKDQQNERLTTQEIAAKQGISEKYMESIAAKLKKGGIIESMRGVNGGYWIVKPLSQIFLGDIMRLMETTYFCIHCKDNAHEDCPNYEKCALAELWGNLEESISGIVDNLSLEEITRRALIKSL